MKSAKDYFNMGYGARRNNLTKTVNPLLFAKGWPHEAWNMGFDFAELELSAPGQSEAMLERVPAQPYWQGWNSYLKGIAPEDCPYGLDTVDGQQWQLGWRQAGEKELEPIYIGCYNIAKWIAALAIIAGLLWVVLSLW